MAMNVQKQIAKKFVEYWTFQRGSEKGEDQQFWNSLLGEVLGLEDVKSHVQYQVPVPMKGTTKFLDAWIPETRVLIEHKSRGVNLDAPQAGHGGLTPYEQAVEYDNARPFDEKARWIVTCNFDEFRIYDRSKPLAPPLTLKLGNLPKEAYRLAFLVNPKEKAIDRELEISVQAGRIVGEIYDALLKQYNAGSLLSLRGDSETRSSGEDSKIPPSLQNAKTPSSESNYLAALNRLCVRLVFCLYAEDAEIFPKDCFRRLMENTPAPFLRERLKKLFEILDTPLNKRDVYLEPELCVFPYTNGGLFKCCQCEIVANSNFQLETGNIGTGNTSTLATFSPDDIPPITDDIRQLLIGASQFDWRDITPTIFGALFESTLNPVTRRAGGMVYTSVENIHKVIDPLFLSDLTRRVNEVLGMRTEDGRQKTEDLGQRTVGQSSVVSPLSSVLRKKLLALQDEMAALTFLDPACGSGNFLTETYICLRRLENRIIAALQQGQGELDLGISVKVSIAQFHGIEINDFAVAVAKTALWIAEAQMLQETAQILHREPNFLPLKDYNGIVEGNALRMDWSSLLCKCENVANNQIQCQLGIGNIGTGNTSTLATFSYIMGNPPFVGASMMTAAQKAEAVAIFGKGKRVNSIDYVGAWYYKAMQVPGARCAFVSTNSITQGEQVAPLWHPLYEKHGLVIDFAHRTFRWDNEAFDKAHVHCVIVGFHAGDNDALGDRALPTIGADHRAARMKTIFDGDRIIPAANICPYLIEAPTVFIESRAKPICDVPQMTYGNKPTDDGNLILSGVEREAILHDTPALAPFIRRYVGSRDFINADEVRYCLWLKDASPAIYHGNREVMRRLAAVHDFRLSSSASPTRKMAEQPWQFFSSPHTESPYLLVPEVSSERRRYVPIGFMDAHVIAANTVSIVPNATVCHFGVLTSSTHMAWMRVVAGRLKSDYRYSGAIVYNNFPWPEGNTSTMAAISKVAQDILDARAAHPDCSLAVLYDPLTMPPDLRAAHEANDRAVLAAYGLAPDTPEPEIVAHLFGLYANVIKKGERK